LNYFGEKPMKIVEFVPIVFKKKEKATLPFSEKILGLLKIQELNSREIQKLTKYKKTDVIFALQNLLENDNKIAKLTINIPT
jgi:ATP-dependent DNA helicase RecQ